MAKQFDNNMMSFGGDMPELEGTTWWKRDGSDHFTIRDILMSPEGFSIRTTDGRLINGDVMETYVQSEVPIEIPKKAPVEKINVAALDPDSPISQERDGNFGSLKYRHDVAFETLPEPRHHPINPVNVEGPVDCGEDGITVSIIDRVLGKTIETKINDLVNITLNTEALKSGVNTLIEILNIPAESIANYLMLRLETKLNPILKEAIDSFMVESTGNKSEPATEE